MRGAPRLGELEVLEDEGAGALAQHEAVAGAVEGPRDVAQRPALPRRTHAAHVGEADVADLVEGCLRGTADGGHVVAAPDALGGLADVVSARRAGRHDAHVGTLGAGLDGDLAGSRVGQHVGDEEGAHRLGALGLQGADGLGHERRAADAGAEDDADVLGVVRVDDEPGVGQGLLGGGHAEDDVLVRATDGLEVHPVLWLEVVDLTRGMAGGDLGIPARDALQAGVAGHDVLPGGGDVTADGADDAEAGDGHASGEVWSAHGAGSTPVRSGRWAARGRPRW